jgi:hypothetical protein
MIHAERSRTDLSLRRCLTASSRGGAHWPFAVWALIEQSERSLIRRWFEAPRFRASINRLCATARSKQARPKGRKRPAAAVGDAVHVIRGPFGAANALGLPRSQARSRVDPAVYPGCPVLEEKAPSVAQLAGPFRHIQRCTGLGFDPCSRFLPRPPFHALRDGPLSSPWREHCGSGSASGSGWLHVAWAAIEGWYAPQGTGHQQAQGLKAQGPKRVGRGRNSRHKALPDLTLYRAAVF